jgi:hypothetical protein
MNKTKSLFLVGSTILVTSFVPSVFGQGPGDKLPIDGGRPGGELSGDRLQRYKTEKTFWGDDAPVTLGIIVALLAACGGGYFYFSKKKKATSSPDS